jgi:hypothetical protein
MAAAAAILLVAVGIGTFLNWQGQQSNPEAPSIAAVTPAAPRTFVLPLEQADLKLPLDSLTWRGSEQGSIASYLSALGEALQPYNRGAFDEAVQKLAALEDRYPDAVEPSFYRGVSQLFLNQPAVARASLERARKLGGAALVSDIEWYLAVANEREGRIQAAASLLADLCAGESPYRNRSCALHPRLKP